MNPKKPLREMSPDEIASLSVEDFKELAGDHNDHLELRESAANRKAGTAYEGHTDPHEQLIRATSFEDAPDHGEQEAERPEYRPVEFMPGVGPSPGGGRYVNSRVRSATSRPEVGPEISTPQIEEKQSEPSRDIHAEYATQVDVVHDLLDDIRAERSGAAPDEKMQATKREALAKATQKQDDLYDTIVNGEDYGRLKLEQEEQRRSKRTGNVRDGR